jgi:predicted nucleic acid-binding protein
MRAYADTSFLVKLLSLEAGSAAAIAGYRRIGMPGLFFWPLHALEVRNAILQRAFHQRHAISSGERQHVSRERDAALGRLERLISRRTLLEVSIDADATLGLALKLSLAHTERLGTRAIDLLHVGAALTLETELFLTADARQAQLAKAAGLGVLFAN